MRKRNANPLEFAGRVFYSDGTYVGRLVSVTEYATTSTKGCALCLVRSIGGDIEQWFYLSDIVLEAD